LACRVQIVDALDAARCGLATRLKIDLIIAVARDSLEGSIDTSDSTIDLCASIAVYDAIEEAMREAIRDVDEEGCGAFMWSVDKPPAAAAASFSAQE
jgi:hypothetical protein